jgi:two-component system, chemotaxis family, protein-glutamate methylesterase/glutaminase
VATDYQESCREVLGHQLKANRDIVVMGGSTGAMDAICKIIATFESEMNAAIFVVIHMGADSPGYLAEILATNSKLPVQFAVDHDPIELGKIYVAPPDRHLLVKPGEVRVIFGPKENNFRPAVDPLFRSAATTYDGRVVGVVVSGSLDDGTHGLLQIKRSGGVAIVQTPDEAPEAGMPTSAISRVNIDYVRSSDEIGPLICQLVRQEVDAAASLGDDETDVSEGLISALRMNGIRSPTPFICPECHGALWEVNDGKVVSYRCHVGHGFGVDTLLKLQATEIEQALWSSVRGFEEQAALQKRTAHKHGTDDGMRERLLRSADEQQQMADLIRSILVRPRNLQESHVGKSVRREYGGIEGAKA